MPWEFDPAHSQIEFAGTHLHLTTLKGGFSRMHITLDLDEADITRSSLLATIDPSSVWTQNPLSTTVLFRLSHLEADRYPTISFRSRHIEQRGDHYAISG